METVRAPCVRCGYIIHYGEGMIGVSLSLDQLEELALATSDDKVARKFVCAISLLDEDRADRVSAERKEAWTLARKKEETEMPQENAVELRVWTDDTDTVVAADLADAQKVWEEHHGSTFEQEMMTLDDWSQVPDDKPITIHNVDGRGTDDDKLTLTAAEWAARDGRGFLCSTEW